MHRQVGDLELDDRGLARRGVLVRHLVMPGEAEETCAIMRFLAKELSRDTYVNIMSQYHPAARVTARPDKYEEINRCVTAREMAAAYDAARREGLHRFDVRRPAGLISP